MQIGIYLGYGPQTILKKEGLGRYVADLICGFEKNDLDITIACPKWLIFSVKELLSDAKIETNKIKFITTKKISIFIKIFTKLKLIKKKKHIIDFNILLNKISKKIVDLGNKVVSINSVSIFIFIIIVLALLFIPISLLLLITVLMLTLLYVVYIIIKKNVKKGKMIIKKADIWDYFTYTVSNIFSGVLNSVIQRENRNLVRIINRSSKIDLWYVPSLFWPAVNSINDSVVVINAPDLVTELFPISFSKRISSVMNIDIYKTIRNGKYFITYSEYVKKNLLIDYFKKDQENCYCIEHVNHDMSKYVKYSVDIGKFYNSKQNFIEINCRNMLLGLGIRNEKYIFYSSQIRPNKNILNLLKAYKYLLREKFYTYKLVLTGNVYADKEIKKYIDDNYLKNDICVAYNVSDMELASLYYCASLVVNPTKFEGGFPFTFSEGMSVGTPSIMSNIPQCTEVIKENVDKLLFNPDDYLDIANKIEYALNNVDYIYNLELPIYRELEKRTPSVVAKEYISIFEKICNKQ